MATFSKLPECFAEESFLRLIFNGEADSERYRKEQFRKEAVRRHHVVKVNKKYGIKCRPGYVHEYDEYLK